MPKKPPAPRSARPADAQMSTPAKKPLVVDDAETLTQLIQLARRVETLTQFFQLARRAWPVAHPEHKKIRGRPLKPDSDLARSADNLVREHTKLIEEKTDLPAAAVDRWASSPATLKALTETLADQHPDAEESTLRRHVRFALLWEKSITALSDSDKRFLATRQLRTSRMLDEAPRMMQRMMEKMPDVIRRFADQVQRDFPTEWEGAEQRGRPLNFAEIERLYATRHNHPPATRPPRSTR